MDSFRKRAAFLLRTMASNDVTADEYAEMYLDDTPNRRWRTLPRWNSVPKDLRPYFRRDGRDRRISANVPTWSVDFHCRVRYEVLA